MSQASSPSFWSKIKIARLIQLLLVLMLIAGLFFTSVFVYLKSQLQQLNEQLSQQPGLVIPDILINTLNLLDFFIIAVLVTMSMFLALMFATLVGKIARPLAQMQKGIEDITQSYDFSRQLPIRHQDEMGIVIQRFNSLTQNLQQVFSQTNQTLSQVAKGDYQQRIEQTGVAGDLLTFSQHVNDSIASLEHTMQSLQQIAQSLTQGQFDQRMNSQVEGQLRRDVDQAMQTLDQVVAQINRVMSGVSDCQLAQRIEINGAGQLAELIKHTNQAMDRLEEGLSGIFAAIDALAEGNLAYQIQGKFSGEMERLKHHLNRAILQVNNTVNQVKQTTAAIENTVHEIVKSNQSLEERTQQQAQSVEETARTLEQLTSSVQQVADHARQANQLTLNAREQTQQGREIMKESVASMHSIQSSSAKINEIIGLIDGISFQTNLLALNASVEAARAGEQGRGFAVVAGEVRNLAQKSAESSKNIRQLIEQVGQEVNQGAAKLETTQHAFETVFQSMQSVNDIVSEIAVSSREQAQGISQVNQAVNQLDDAIQHNAQMVQHNSQLAQDLQQLETSLRQETERFSTAVPGLVNNKA